MESECIDYGGSWLRLGTANDKTLSFTLEPFGYDWLLQPGECLDIYVLATDGDTPYMKVFENGISLFAAASVVYFEGEIVYDWFGLKVPLPPEGFREP